MQQKIYLDFGIPEHGWLPVEFSYESFTLNFSASDILNDPLLELLIITQKLTNGEKRLVNWFTEPGAYIFEFEMINSIVDFKIIEMAEFRKNSNYKTIFTLKTESNFIVKPLKKAMENLLHAKFNSKDWKTEIRA